MVVLLLLKIRQFIIYQKIKTMKKVFALTLLAAILFGSCEKEGVRTAVTDSSLNSIVELPNDGKKESSTFLLSTMMGHSSSSCSGCVMYNGNYVHFDCMGHGNQCATSSVVSLQQVGSAISITTTDTFNLTSGNFFLMPNRSLDYMDQSGLHTYLNIPGQLVYRDTTTLQFTFTGLFFSSKPAYGNL